MIETNEAMFLYHGTSSVAAEAILSEGLIARKGQGCDAWVELHYGYMRDACASDLSLPPGLRRFVLGHWEKVKLPLIFLAEHSVWTYYFARRAAFMAGGDPVVLKVTIPKSEFQNLKLRRDPRSICGWELEENIPPERVSVYEIASGYSIFRKIEKAKGE